MALEHIYHARNRHFIGPTSFKANLLTYFHSKSKSACKILSHFGPFGSYTSLIQWLGEQGKIPNSAPTHELLTFFDNNQVVCKNHHVKVNNTMKTSTITSVIHITSKDHTDLQSDTKLCPSLWLPDFQLNHGQQLELHEFQQQAQEKLG